MTESSKFIATIRTKWRYSFWECATRLLLAERLLVSARDLNESSLVHPDALLETTLLEQLSGQG